MLISIIMLGVEPHLREEFVVSSKELVSKSNHYSCLRKIEPDWVYPLLPDQTYLLSLCSPKIWLRLRRNQDLVTHAYNPSYLGD
jgi:hypothetical protein